VQARAEREHQDGRAGVVQRGAPADGLGRCAEQPGGERVDGEDALRPVEPQVAVEDLAARQPVRDVGVAGLVGDEGHREERQA
jgi:hypothetical protein